MLFIFRDQRMEVEEDMVEGEGVAGVETRTKRYSWGVFPTSTKISSGTSLENMERFWMST